MMSHIEGADTSNISDCYKKRVFVLGCGNTFFGDDGFGPAVAEHIQENHEVPGDTCVLDVGTGASEILFTVLLSEKRPEKIIIIDAVDLSRVPGEFFEIDLETLPKQKAHDFSVHLFPSTNLLRELRDLCGVEVRIIACQVGHIPEEVEPGLSKPVQEAVPKVGEYVMRHL